MSDRKSGTNLDGVRRESANVCQGEVMLDWFGCEFGSKSLTGHSHPIEQLLGTRSAALIQPGTQLRKMEKRADGLDQTDASDASLSIPTSKFIQMSKFHTRRENKKERKRERERDLLIENVTSRRKLVSKPTTLRFLLFGGCCISFLESNVS